MPAAAQTSGKVHLKCLLSVSFRLSLLVALLKPRGTENTEASAFKSICLGKTKKSHLCTAASITGKSTGLTPERNLPQELQLDGGKKRKDYLICLLFRQKHIFSSACLCFMQWYFSRDRSKIMYFNVLSWEKKKQIYNGIRKLTQNGKREKQVPNTDQNFDIFFFPY